MPAWHRFWDKLLSLWATVRNVLVQYAWGRAIFVATENYTKHGCVYMTGALSFYAVVSLIPLVFIALYVLVEIIQDPKAHDHVKTMLDQYLLPGAVQGIFDQGSEVYSRGLRNLLQSWWAIPAFIWTGIRFYESLHHALTMAWGGTGARPFFQRKAWTLLAFIGASVFFGMTISLTTAATTLEVVDQQVMGISLVSVWLLIVNEVLPWLFAAIMFFLLYKFMPNTYVPPKLALLAAIPVSIVWNIMKEYFTGYVVTSGFYSASGIYGPMASIVLLMVWIYFSAVIVLFGAEYASAWQGEAEKAKGSGNSD